MSEPAEPPVCEARNVCKTYHLADSTVEALRDVSFTIGRGEFVSIMGPSGSGKSTLLSVLAGLEPCDSGQVLLEGQPLGDKSDDELSALRRQKMGFVFQSFNLVPVLTVEDNIALPLILQGLPRAAWKPKVEPLLDQLDLRGRARHTPERTSIGERQRTAIARALITHPPIIFADEPTGSLDKARGDQVLDLLRAACDDGITVLMVTHDRAAAARTDRTLILDDGVLQR